MKAFSAAAFAAIVICGLSPASLAHTGPAVQAHLLSEVTTDGNFDDWPGTLSWTELSHTDFGTSNGPDDLSGRFAVGFDWDAGTLHIALDIADDRLIRETQAEQIEVLRDNPDGALIYLDLVHRGIRTENIELSWVREPILVIDQSLAPTSAYDIARAETATGVRYEFRADLTPLYQHYDLQARSRFVEAFAIGFNVEYWDRDSANDGAVLRWTTGPRDGEDSRLLGDLFISPTTPSSLRQLTGIADWDDRASTHHPRQAMLTKLGNAGFTVWAETDANGRFTVRVPDGDYELRATDSSTLLGASDVVPISVAGEDIDLSSPVFTRADNAGIDELIPAMMAETGTRTVGVALVEGGEISYTRTFGVESDGDPATDETVFRVASITKPVSAAAVFSLVSQGRWSLDTPLAEHWIDPDLASDDRVYQLTSRLVLRHLTGLPNWRGGSDLWFDHDPNSHQSYSGEGYEWMRRALERAFDEDFQSINAREVFDPAGMTRTSHGWPDWAGDSFAGEYFASGGPVDHTTSSEPNAAANLLSTPTDLANFAIWFMETRAGMTDAQWENMITANSRDIIPMESWAAHGLSWLVHTDDGQLVLEHSGGQWGINTHLILLPERNSALVVLTNSSAGWPIVARAFDATLNADGSLPNTRAMMYSDVE